MANKRDGEVFEFPEFRGAPLDALIGRPLVAGLKGNEMMAREQVKFLLDTCFYRHRREPPADRPRRSSRGRGSRPPEVGEVYEPVMITMSMTRSVLEAGDGRGSASIGQATIDFQVPLLTILPISSLAVEDMAFEFDMEVYSQVEVEESKEGPLASSERDRTSHELLGSIKYGSRQSAESQRGQDAHISVTVAAGSLPLPLGVNIILDAYSKAILPTGEGEEDGKDW